MSSRKSKNSGKTTTRKHARAIARADQENARLREERSGSPDGMTASERAMSRSAAAKPAKEKSLSLLDAAAQVLADSPEPMTTGAMIEQVLAKGLWTAGKGKTPSATLYSAILRESKVKGDTSRFKKTDRGLFTRNTNV